MKDKDIREHVYGLMKKIESAEFECEAGPIEKFCPWGDLKHVVNFLLDRFEKDINDDIQDEWERCGREDAEEFCFATSFGNDKSSPWMEYKFFMEVPYLAYKYRRRKRKDKPDPAKQFLDRIAAVDDEPELSQELKDQLAKCRPTKEIIDELSPAVQEAISELCDEPDIYRFPDGTLSMQEWVWQHKKYGSVFLRINEKGINDHELIRGERVE